MGKIIASAKKNGKFLGRPAGSPEQIERYIEQVFLFFQSPSELGLLRSGARDLLEPLGKRGISPRDKSLY